MLKENQGPARGASRGGASKDAWEGASGERGFSPQGGTGQARGAPRFIARPRSLVDRDRARAVLVSGYPLQDYEQAFVASVPRLYRAGYGLSAKQKRWLDRLHARTVLARQPENRP